MLAMEPLVRAVEQMGTAPCPQLVPLLGGGRRT